MKNEKLATHKEFGKMLRAVADIYIKYGNTPLYDSTPEIKDKVFYVVNRGAYDGYIEPWMRSFAEHPIDVTEAIKWTKKVEEGIFDDVTKLDHERKGENCIIN